MLLTQQTWSMFENESLFIGQHPHGSKYSPEVHLVAIIAALGPLPVRWLEKNPSTLTNLLEKACGSYYRLTDGWRH